MTRISIPTNFALISGFELPLQVPTKTIRSISDNYIEPDGSEKFISQDTSSGVTSHQFNSQNTANLPFSQFKRTQRNLPRYNPFTDSNNQTQGNQTAANQPNRSNDQTFMLITITTNVPTLSRLPLAPLSFVDTYSLILTSNMRLKQILI